MSREHEREERPFEPERAPSWKGSSRDLVVNGPKLRVNPDQFFIDLEELVDRYENSISGDPDDVKRELREIFEASGGRPSDKLQRADKLLGTHGIESLPGDRYTYLNTGDTYGQTIIYDSEENKFFVSDWGSVEEQAEPERQNAAWDDWIKSDFARALRKIGNDAIEERLGSLTGDAEAFHRQSVSAASRMASEEALIDDDDAFHRLFNQALRDTPSAELVTQSDGSVFVHKFDDVVDTAYEILQRGAHTQNRSTRRRNSSESDLEADGTLKQLLDMAAESAESTVSRGALEITPELSRAALAYETDLRSALDALVKKYPPENGASADDLWTEGTAPYLVLMTLRGEGVGIWDGDWDAFYSDTKRAEGFLKERLWKHADDSGSGSLHQALDNAVYDAEQRTGAERQENRRRRR